MSPEDIKAKVLGPVGGDQVSPLGVMSGSPTLLCNPCLLAAHEGVLPLVLAETTPQLIT